MQQRRVVVVMIDDVLDSFMPELVRRAIDQAVLDATAGQPHAEAVRVVIAADVLFVLNDGQPPHLTAPVDERRIEHPAILQILDQGRRGLIGLLADVGQAFLDPAVVIPGLIAGVDLDEADAAFDEPPGDQAT